MQRPGAEMASFAAIAGAETAPTREFGRHVFDITAQLRVSITLYNYRVCVVETVWFELPTPHPVIEPVSDTRVRNGNFRCRDRGPKWPHSRRLQEQRLRQPENLADMSLTSRRNCECLLLYTTTECAWWRRYGSNCQLPTQSSNRSLTLESGTEIFDAETGGRNGLIRGDCRSRDCANQRIWQTCL